MIDPKNHSGYITLSMLFYWDGYLTTKDQGTGSISEVVKQYSTMIK